MPARPKQSAQPAHPVQPAPSPRSAAGTSERNTGPATGRSKGRKPGPALPPPRASGRLILRLPPKQVGLLRFLLEGYDNLAYFTVLERREALLKLVFSPQRERAVRRALAEIAESLPLRVEEYPFAGPAQADASPAEGLPAKPCGNGGPRYGDAKTL